VFLHIDYLDIERSMPYDTHRITGTERQGRAMLMSHKAFEIYMGHAGEDTDFSRDEAPIDAMASGRTPVADDGCSDAMASGRPGWLSRTVASTADRAQLPRNARG
jgi:hypothetical protein